MEGPGIIFAGMLVFMLLMIICVILCAIFDATPIELPEELWDFFTWTLPERFFEKSVVIRHKNGDMSGIAAVTYEHYIDVGDVKCRKINPQDVLDTNLDILAMTVISKGKPATWAEKVKEMAQDSRAVREILDNYYYTEECKVPEELLEAMLADEESLFRIANYMGHNNVIEHMERYDSKAAALIMKKIRERKEKKYVR